MPLLDRYFHTLSETMARESRLMAAVFSHPGKLGENREQLLARFLTTYLPRRFGVGSGFALLGERLSTQQDVVVYDANDNPVLFPTASAPLFPPSAVLALIEVKSRLTKRELLKTVRKTADFKRQLRQSFANHPAPPEQEALAMLFAFDTTSKPARVLTVLCDVEDGDEVERRDRLDMVCLLGKGVVLGGALLAAMTPGAGEPERLAIELDDSLLVFYARLLDYLSARPPTRPQLMAYLPAATPMGLVTAVG